MKIRTRVRELLQLAISDLAHAYRPRRGLRERRSAIESLEARTLLTAYSVTNLNDAGVGSLRDAVSRANGNSGADTITFATSGTITLSSGQLAITDSVTITGPGADKLSVSGGNAATRIFQIDNSNSSLIDVAISNLTICDGGDGITSIDGAGLRSSENLTLRGVAVSGNNAANRGGGGIQIYGGNFVLQSSTIANNRAEQGAGIQLFGNSATIINSTISGNWANGTGGGLIALLGAATVLNSTITNNRCDADGSGEGVDGGAAGNPDLLTLHNTIVAGNFQGTGTTPWDASQLTAMSSYNLIGFAGADVWLTNGVNGNIVGVNGSGNRDIATILNTTLANNGGPTPTHALLPGSPAIDRGSNAAAVDMTQAGSPPLTTDQRGNPIARIANSTVDIGAYELFTVAVPIVVSTTVEELDSDISTGDLSLREAIVLANGSTGANTITFATSTSGTEFDLTLGQMVISETVTITGIGAANSVIDAQQLSRIFEVTGTAGNVTLNDLTFKNGRTRGNGTDFWDTTYAGGAVHFASPGVLTLNRTRFTGNSTLGERAGGGAILVGQGTLIVNESWLYGNSTGGVNAEGGAISAHLGSLQVRNSTLSGNLTSGNYSEGGAIFSLAGNVSVSQSTLSGNIASGIDSQGGGLFTQQGYVFISQSTITDNEATISAGGGIFTHSSPISILNSIVALNLDAGSSPDLRTSPDSSDVFLIMSSLIGRNNGTNLAATSGTTPDPNGNFVGGTTNATKIDPKLGLLANNGGPTMTHALLTGSLAIDRGSNAAAVDVTNANAALLTDQRGVTFARFIDGDLMGTAPAATVDMGAVEFSGLRLTSPSPTTMALRPTLTWTAIAGATRYNIWVNNLSTGAAAVYVSSATGTSHTVTSDFALGKYRVQIQPVFGAVNGNWSLPTSIFVLPPVIFQTMPILQLVSRPVISWNALPGAVKYDLWLDNVTSGQKQFVRQDVTGTSFTPSADLPMGTYRVWVRGVDKIGNFGAWSARYDAQVLPGATPIGPLNATFDRTPTFSWQPVAGAVSYEVYVRNSNATNVVNGQSTTATNWTPTVNLADGQYRWWVIAVNAADFKSGGATTTDIFVGGRPTVIAPVVGSSLSNRTPTFTWKAVDGAASYHLQVNRIDVATPKIIFRPGLTGTSFTATAALPAGTYRVWVQAVSSTGEASPWSVQFDAPAIFTITATSPTLNWLDDEWQLTGLLTSDISKKLTVDDQHAPPSPPVDVRDQEDAAIDQIMSEIFLVPATTNLPRHRRGRRLAEEAPAEMDVCGLLLR